MEATQRGARTRWEISRESFEGLLRRLGTDPASAGQRYEALHARLTFYFLRRNLNQAEDLADEVLDRLARRLDEGTEIASVESFAHGIARFVAQEQATASSAAAVSDAFFGNIPAAAPTYEREEKLAAMEQCLAGLSPADAELLAAYYTSRGAERIAARKSTAARIGISSVATRQRIFQLRKRLRACMERTLGQS